MKKLLVIAIGSFLFFTSCKETKKSEVKEAIDNVEVQLAESIAEMKTDINDVKDDVNQELVEIEAKLKDAEADAKKELELRKARLIKLKASIDEKIRSISSEANNDLKTIKKETSEWMTEVKQELKN